MVNSFDWIAKYYDTISTLIFQTRLRTLATIHLKGIPAKSKVLLLGGGSGYCLTKLTNCEIDFIEKSSKMIDLAKNRATTSQVSFVCEDFLLWDDNNRYDYIICPFFLDVFNESNLSKVLGKIRRCMDAQSFLIVTDFSLVNTMPYRALLKVMHFFFSVTAQLESKELLPLNDIIHSEGFRERETICTRRKFIFSSEYQLLRH